MFVNFGAVFVDLTTASAGNLSHVPVWVIDEGLSNFQFFFFYNDEHPALPSVRYRAGITATQFRALPPRFIRAASGGELTDRMRRGIYEAMAERRPDYDAVKFYIVSLDPSASVLVERLSSLGIDAKLYPSLYDLFLAGVASRSKSESVPQREQARAG